MKRFRWRTFIFSCLQSYYSNILFCWSSSRLCYFFFKQINSFVRNIEIILFFAFYSWINVITVFTTSRSFIFAGSLGNLILVSLSKTILLFVEKSQFLSFSRLFLIFHLEFQEKKNTVFRKHYNRYSVFSQANSLLCCKKWTIPSIRTIRMEAIHPSPFITLINPQFQLLRLSLPPLWFRLPITHTTPLASRPCHRHSILPAPTIPMPLFQILFKISLSTVFPLRPDTSRLAPSPTQLLSLVPWLLRCMLLLNQRFLLKWALLQPVLLCPWTQFLRTTSLLWTTAILLLVSSSWGWLRLAWISLPSIHFWICSSSSTSSLIAMRSISSSFHTFATSALVVHCRMWLMELPSSVVLWWFSIPYWLLLLLMWSIRLQLFRLSCLSLFIWS